MAPSSGLRVHVVRPGRGRPRDVRLFPQVVAVMAASHPGRHVVVRCPRSRVRPRSGLAAPAARDDLAGHVCGRHRSGRPRPRAVPGISPAAVLSVRRAAPRGSRSGRHCKAAWRPGAARPERADHGRGMHALVLLRCTGEAIVRIGGRAPARSTVLKVLPSRPAATSTSATAMPACIASTGGSVGCGTGVSRGRDRPGSGCRNASTSMHGIGSESPTGPIAGCGCASAIVR